jgi:RNA polymerase sigma-70 factor (ECF subfamily)
MADNLMHDRFRSAEARRERERSWDDVTGTSIRGISDEPSVERQLLARERLARVERALGGLSERAQSIFRRFRVDGVGHRAIAAEHGISVSAVEKNIQRAYRSLMQEMEERGSPPSPETDRWSS